MENIIASQVLACDIWMDEKDIIELIALYEDEFPEHNFINAVYNKIKIKAKINNKLTGNDISVHDFVWCGESSGTSYNLLLTGIFPRLKGFAEIVYIWDNGNITGIKINNGQVKQCKIEIKLIN